MFFIETVFQYCFNFIIKFTVAVSCNIKVMVSIYKTIIIPTKKQKNYLSSYDTIYYTMCSLIFLSFIIQNHFFII